MTVEVRNRQPRKSPGLRVDTTRLKALTIRALELAGADAGYNLSVVLVSDKQIAALNARFHHVKGPTDILSFDYGTGVGELIISLERARSQACRFHTTLARELALYVIHGILHLHHHDDRTVRERRCIRAAERRLMKCLEREMLIQDIIRQ